MRCLLLCAVLLIGLTLIGCSAVHVTDTRPDYLALVRGYADAMIERGRDTYGERHSPLFAAALDRKTCRVFGAMPPDLPSMRKRDRTFSGANPMHDLSLYQTLYALTEITGETRYAREADAALKWFFENCQSPKGLMAWGEHQGWSFLTDKPSAPRAHHEFYRPWVLASHTTALAPEAMHRLAVGLWEHQIGDHATGAFSRHARLIWDPAQRSGGRGAEFPRHGGFYIELWARDYQRTGSPLMLHAIEVLLQSFLDRRDPTRPYCLVVSFWASHPPLIPPAFYLERYLRTGVPDPVIGDWATPPRDGGIGLGVDSWDVDLAGEALLSARAGYYGLLNHLDDQIRRLTNGRRSGVSLDDTVIVYTADHGEMLGDHYCWGKRIPYQGSVHIPFLVRTPASWGYPRGQTLSNPICLEDVMPTLLELAGVPIPDTVEGDSLAPLLRGESTPWREFVHIECAPLHQTLTDGKEKFVWFTADGREQFFRLSEDPDECHDLIDRPQEAERIAHWRRLLIGQLTGREEGFTDGERLIAGREAIPGGG